MTTLTQPQILNALVSKWQDRRTAQGLKPKSVRHDRAMIEFFIGAAQALEITGQAINPMVLILLCTGHPVETLITEPA